MIRKLIDTLKSLVIGQGITQFGNTVDANSPQMVPAPDVKNMSSQELMDYCDRFWEQLAEEEAGHDVQVRIAWGHYQQAIAELQQHGSDVRSWAIERLRHSDYEAREQAAGLIWSLARRQLLEDDRSLVISELSRLADRKRGEESKEVQANSVAVLALAEIGDRECIPALHTILNSPYWDNDDLSWSAAEALSPNCRRAIHGIRLTKRHRSRMASKKLERVRRSLFDKPCVVLHGVV